MNVRETEQGASSLIDAALAGFGLAYGNLGACLLLRLTGGPVFWVHYRLRAIAPHLLRIISDEKMLFAALKHMETEGSHAPGPDGLRYEDIALTGAWEWCRIFRDDIREGEYTPSDERLQKIPKGPGRGF